VRLHTVGADTDYLCIQFFKFFICFSFDS
jgi:hypothetical protein